MSLENLDPHITQFQSFIEQIKNKLLVPNEEIAEFLLPEYFEHENGSFINYSAHFNVISEKNNKNEKESDDGGASFHSWEVSSTPGFNDVIIVRDYKKRLVVDECKSAELNPKKSAGECFSFK